MPLGSDVSVACSPKKLERNGKALCVNVTKEENDFRESNYSDVKNVLKEEILCSTCGENLKPLVTDGCEIYCHPHLKVLLCESCRNEYHDVNFSPDEDGTDKYCRWCAQGGSLYCCSKCVCTFCKKCIRRNFGRDMLKTLDDNDWECFLCKPEPLYKCRAICYAAIELSRFRRRKKHESHKSRISEMADKKRLGIKSKHMDPSHRRKSSDSDVEVITCNEDSDLVISSKPQKHASAHENGPDGRHCPKQVRRPKHPKPQPLKAIKKVRGSSEDMTDSDFEPKNSQRLKPRLLKKSHQLKDTTINATSRDLEESGPSHMDSFKLKKEDDSASSRSSTPKQQWMLLDSHAEDIACVAGVLNDQISKFKKRYLEQSWEENMLPMAINNLQRYVNGAVQSLRYIGESLGTFGNSSCSLKIEANVKEEISSGQELNQERETGASDGSDSGVLDAQRASTSLNRDTAKDKCKSPAPKPNDSCGSGASRRSQRCGSTDSDNSLAPPLKVQRCGSIDSEGNQDADVAEVMEIMDSPMAIDKTTNAIINDGPLEESCDLFADEDMTDNQPDHCEGEVSETQRKKSSCEEKVSPNDRVKQSMKSLACKASLLDSSSSESECEEHVNTRKVHETDSTSDLEFNTCSSNHIKANFSIKDLDVYKSDAKLQGTWSVNMIRMGELEEKRYLEQVEHYYDADSDSDHSVDNLTNLHNLKRKAKESDDSSEKSSRSSDEMSSKRKKPHKNESEEEKKLSDFLNQPNAETSEAESSFEMRSKLACEDSMTLNDVQKKMLLQSSDSENDLSDSKSPNCSKDAKKLKVIEKEQSSDNDPIETNNVGNNSECNSEKSNGETEKEETEELAEKKKAKDWRKDKLLTAKLSDTDTSDEERRWQKKKENTKDDAETTDSDQILAKKCKTHVSSKKAADSDIDHSSSTSEDFVKKKRKAPQKKTSSSSSSESEKARTKKKRRRIKLPNSDSSEEEEEQNAESPTKSGRRKIRHVIREDELEEGTKEAAKAEEERLKRIAERQKMYDEVYETVQKGFDVLEKLVLDFDEKTKEPLVEVEKSLVKKLKPHQAKGIKFMWDACFESLKRIKTSKGSGCILAHCMGLGKTFQVVTLVHTLFKYPETKINTVLVVCPVSTVLNWVSEFHKWLQGLEDQPEVFEMTRCKPNERPYRLREWRESGGVMVLGYDMFRNLTNPESKRARSSIVKTFQNCLVDPGPDMVICDEGHLLKNEDTGISKAMTRVKTLRRVILTGTPLQNNLKEYHCMVQFVKPNLLGTRKEFLNRFVNPITNGQFEDSTSHDVKKMKRRAHVLHKTLEGCVQRYDYSVLTPFLPSKEEYVISVRLTELQEKLYRHYLEHFSSKGYQGKGAQLFTDFQQLQRIWTHPRVLKMSQERNEAKAEKEEEDDSEGSLKDFIDDGSENSDSNTSSSSSASSSNDDDVVCLSDGSHSEKKKSKEAPKSGRRTRSNKDVPSVTISIENPLDPEPPEPSKRGEWWESYTQADDLEDLRASSKLVLLFSILKDCEENGEKLLVFSQSLFSLDVIEYFLGKIDDATQRGVEDKSLNGHQGSWSLGIDYFRLDGSTPTETRSTWCNLFNKSSNLTARLFLISTKAGGLGINLVAANRVIIFDASWNPSHDVQSIFRVYRFGQKKPCFIYRFLAQGTMEEKIYERQVTKLSLACRVVDELQIERYYKMSDLQELYNFSPADRNTHVLPKLPKDHLFAEILKSHKDLITTYHEHDSLLENKEGEELNEEERKAAWEDYETEKKGPIINQGVQFGFTDALPSVEQLAIAIKERHPEKTEQEATEAAAQAYRQMFLQRQQQSLLQQQLFQQQQLKQQQHLRMQQQMQLALQQSHQTYLQQQQQYPNILYNQHTTPRLQQPLNFQQMRNLTPQVSIAPTLSMPSHSRQGLVHQALVQQQKQIYMNPFTKPHQ